MEGLDSWVGLIKWEGFHISLRKNFSDILFNSKLFLMDLGYESVVIVCNFQLTHLIV